jgi:hypothetical protein
MKEEPFTFNAVVIRHNKVANNLIEILQRHEQVMNLPANCKVVQFDVLDCPETSGSRK